MKLITNFIMVIRVAVTRSVTSDKTPCSWHRQNQRTRHALSLIRFPSENKLADLLSMYSGLLGVRAADESPEIRDYQQASLVFLHTLVLTNLANPFTFRWLVAWSVVLVRWTAGWWAAWNEECLHLKVTSPWKKRLQDTFEHRGY
jgi:hypothetical protein